MAIMARTGPGTARHRRRAKRKEKTQKCPLEIFSFPSDYFVRRAPLRCRSRRDGRRTAAFLRSFCPISNTRRRLRRDPMGLVGKQSRGNGEKYGAGWKREKEGKKRKMRGEKGGRNRGGKKRGEKKRDRKKQRKKRAGVKGKKDQKTRKIGGKKGKTGKR